MSVLATLLLRNPQLLQQISGKLQKDVGNAPMQPQWMQQPAGGRTVLPEGSIGGGFLPSGLQLAGRLAGVHGGPITSPGAVPAGTMSRLPPDDRAAIGAGGNFMSGSLGNEGVSELRNRVARSLLDFFGGDQQAAARAYSNWLQGEQNG